MAHISQTRLCRERQKASLGLPSILGDLGDYEFGERATKKTRTTNDILANSNSSDDPRSNPLMVLPSELDVDDAPFAFDSGNGSIAPDDSYSDNDEDGNAGIGGVTSEDEGTRDVPPCRRNMLQFREYVAEAKESFAPLTKEEVSGIKLMDLLRKKKATLDTYDEVMRWHLVENEVLMEHQGLGEACGYLSREVLLKRLAKRYNMVGKEPTTSTFYLPSCGTKVSLVRHNFCDLVHSLLTDPRLCDDDFLWNNPDDPLASPPKNPSYISDLNTGEAYLKTYKELIKDPTKQILCGIPFYIDGAVTGQYDKLQVEQLKFTLGIFNQKAREKDHCWRTLGYVCNYNDEDSQGRRILQQSGHISGRMLDIVQDEGRLGKAKDDTVHKAQDKHAILKQLLESYAANELGGMAIDLNFKGQLYRDKELVFFIPYIKADTQEADMLCGHYTNRTKAEQICRYCTCPTQRTNKILDEHPYRTENQIKRAVERNDAQQLKAWSQHPIDNAFHGLRFGLHNKRGIHGACPMEMLHMLLLGIFLYVRNEFFIQMGAKSEVALHMNALAKVYGRLFTRQSDRDMPRTSFMHGIQKGKLMAKEYTGVLLIMAAMLRSAEGKRVLKTARKGHFKSDFLIDDWSLLVETLLQWEEYLKQPQMQKKHVRLLQDKHRFIMYLITRVARRRKGMGLKIVKFHGIVHMADDIRMYGVPMGLDTGANESHHKITKVAAKLTNRNHATFEKFTAQRLFEFHLLDLAKQEMEGRPLWEYLDGYGYYDSDSDDEGSNDEDPMPPLEDHEGGAAPAKKPVYGISGTRIKVSVEPETGEGQFEFPGSKMAKANVKWEKSIIHFLLGLQTKCYGKLPGDFIDIGTEHIRGVGNIFRAHPNYRGKGAWNDWALFDWADDGGELPGEIWCFIDLRELMEPIMVEGLDGEYEVGAGVYAVIESSSYQPRELQVFSSGLFTSIVKEVAISRNGKTLKRQFYLADVESIVSPLIVVPDIGNSHGDNYYFEVTPRTKWAEDFAAWLEVDDEEEIEEDSDTDAEDEESDEEMEDDA